MSVVAFCLESERLLGKVADDGRGPFGPHSVLVAQPDPKAPPILFATLPKNLSGLAIAQPRSLSGFENHTTECALGIDLSLQISLTAACNSKH